jgi:hypothetical protein
VQTAAALPTKVDLTGKDGRRSELRLCAKVEVVVEIRGKRLWTKVFKREGSCEES